MFERVVDLVGQRRPGGENDLSGLPFDRHVLYVALTDKDPSVAYEIDVASSEIDDEVQLGMSIKRPTIASIFKSLVPVFFMVFVAGFTLLLEPKSAAGRLSTATGGLMSVVMFRCASKLDHRRLARALSFDPLFDMFRSDGRHLGPMDPAPRRRRKPSPRPSRKPELEPFLRLLPLFIFGVCGAVSLLVTVATFVLRR